MEPGQVAAGEKGESGNSRSTGMQNSGQEQEMAKGGKPGHAQSLEAQAALM